MRVMMRIFVGWRGVASRSPGWWRGTAWRRGLSTNSSAFAGGALPLGPGLIQNPMQEGSGQGAGFEPVSPCPALDYGFQEWTSSQSIWNSAWLSLGQRLLYTLSMKPTYICSWRIGGMGAVLRERAGAEGARRAADGGHEGCGPGWWRQGAALSHPLILDRRLPEIRVARAGVERNAPSRGGACFQASWGWPGNTHSLAGRGNRSASSRYWL